MQGTASPIHSNHLEQRSTAHWGALYAVQLIYYAIAAAELVKCCVQKTFVTKSSRPFY